MGEVIDLNITTLVDLPVDDVLDGAREAGLCNVFVVGEDMNGNLYIAATSSDNGFNGWMLDHAKAHVMRMSEPPVVNG